MSIYGLFDIGKSALFASQTALQTTSSNIANANTPGYSRQEVVLAISHPAEIRGGYLGRGVSVAGIRRNYDSFIQAQLLGQRQNYGRSAALQQSLSQIEQVFNDGAGLGLSRPLAAYFSAWHEVSTNPEGLTQRQVLLQNGSALARAAQATERSILDTVRAANDEIGQIVDRVNAMAKDVALLNERIVQAEAGLGREAAHDLRNQRDAVLTDLSQLIEFSSFEDANGAVTVTAGMRNLVAGARTNTLSAVTNQEGDKDLTLDGINITPAVQNGRVGGLISVREDIKANALTSLRKLVASITREVNLQHNAGFGLDGSTGSNFFAPLQLATRDYSAGADITATITDLTQVTLDEYDVRFDSGGNYYVYSRPGGTLAASGVYASGSPITVNGVEFTITGAVTATDRFVVSPLENAVRNFGVALSDPQQVAASSSALELPGNNVNALALAGLADSGIANLQGSTFSAYYQSIVSTVGTQSRASQDTLTFDENLMAELANRRESLSGVSLDEEAANLLRYQRSFEAGARLISVADELLQTVLRL